MTELVEAKSLNPGDVVVVGDNLKVEMGLSVNPKQAVYVGGDSPAEAVHYSRLLVNGYTHTTKLDKMERVEKSDLVKVEFERIRLNKSYFVTRGYASGTDPEVFVVGGNGDVIPARRFLEDKKLAKEDFSTGDQFSKGWPTPPMFFDGLQAEFSVKAATCLEALHESTRRGLAGVLNRARKIDPKARLTLKNTIKMSPEQMFRLDEEDLVFRCSTSLNVYDDVAEAPDPRSYEWRFAGGHIHIGCGRKTPEIVRASVRSLDGILGVVGVSLAGNWDSHERRRMYGRAGEFRLPKHGLEYRVLSNFWVCSPLIAHLVFEIARWAVSFGEQGFFKHVWEGSEEEIRDIINWCDVKGARKMLGNNKHILQALVDNRKSEGWSQNQRNLAIETVMNGLEVVVKDPENIEENWRLNENSDSKRWAQYCRAENCQWATLKT